MPRPEQAQQILEFQEGEELVVDTDLTEPADDTTICEVHAAERQAKLEMRKLEAEVSRWQVLEDQALGSNTSDFDNQTLAVLRGRLVRYWFIDIFAHKIILYRNSDHDLFNESRNLRQVIEYI